MAKTVKVLLLAGGQGTRLWPKSRRLLPKQFMTLGLAETLFQRSLRRLLTLPDSYEVYVVAPKIYESIVKLQAPNLSATRILTEPTAHGTVATLSFSLARLQALSLRDDDVILTLPTDAYVGDDDTFIEALTAAVDSSRQSGDIVTVGIRPDKPETGYGYILTGERLDKTDLRVEKFVEKPSLDRAKEYIKDPRYLWNAGIFAWRAKELWNLLKDHLPDVHAACRQLLARGNWDDFSALTEWYERLPNQTFEYALVEKAARIRVIPAQFAWSDLGTWEALLHYLPMMDSSKRDETDSGDEAENHSSKKSASANGARSSNGASLVTLDAFDNQVFHEDGLVALFGVKNLLVVRTNDVVLVCHRDKAKDLKQLLSLIRESQDAEYL